MYETAPSPPTMNHTMRGRLVVHRDAVCLPRLGYRSTDWACQVPQAGYSKQPRPSESAATADFLGKIGSDWPQPIAMPRIGSYE